MKQLIKAGIEFLQVLTLFLRFQMQFKCKHCGRTYERTAITNDELKPCKCGHSIVD